VYSGIASVLSPRPWLLTSASPRSIVRVSGTTHLLFPHTQSISIYYYTSVYEHHWKVFYIKIAIFLLFWVWGNSKFVVPETLPIDRGEADVNSQGRGNNKLAIPEYTVYKYCIILKNIRLIVKWSQSISI
jgi:hypothetical protein